MTHVPPGALFAVLCLAWGSQWLALKIGVADLPPLAFAAVRSVLAGTLMALLAGPREVAALVRAAPGAVLATAVLTNTLTYAGLYWGTSQVSAGLAAIVNNALMPVGLFVFGLALREETYSRRRVAGVALGAVGLALLFLRRSGATLDAAGIAGIAAVVGGTLASCLGAVRSRPLLRRSPPIAVGSAQMLVGGIVLVPLAAAMDAPGGATLAAFLAPVPLAALAWMTVVGGVVGMTAYLRLIRDWGPARAGLYAFVSPIVATALGAAVLGERLGPLEVAGGAVMLAAAALALPGSAGGRRAPPSATP